jgi:hypothetical protein
MSQRTVTPAGGAAGLTVSWDNSQVTVPEGTVLENPARMPPRSFAWPGSSVASCLAAIPFRDSGRVDTDRRPHRDAPARLTTL